MSTSLSLSNSINIAFNFFKHAISQEWIVLEGLKDQTLDQCFANDMLTDIDMAVGVPLEPSEISKELAYFRKKKLPAGSKEMFLGLKDQTLDQCFANDMLTDIDMAVGVPLEPSEISKELAYFRKKKLPAGSKEMFLVIL
ncbi:unnamed protein product [Prunus armeniaca]|uniref:Uncharacterized protein n=1 Tax=Prunus armeniaca TaxID=36596 RepID=A0A6J5TCM6_PRUAR|nr:unnamed protein product [Prunus armeniaca]